MVTQITVAKFLELYESSQIEEPLTVTVSGETRIYARTINGSVLNKAKVVYCVI